MKIAMIGLGKMGANMVRRLVGDGHEIIAYSKSPDTAIKLAQEDNNITPVANLDDLIKSLSPPRLIWLMVPHQVVDQSIEELIHAGMEKDDLLVDGGNSNFNLSKKRAKDLAKSGIHFVDCGTSGGVWGLENGYSIMAGGSDEAINLVKPILQSLAPAVDKGWGHVGPAGAGHYVKMVHNGIEYGMMQAFAEGFALLKGKSEFNLDMAQVSELWRHSSVVRSWLLDLTAESLAQDQELAEIGSFVADSGEGRWTAIEAIDQGVALPVISLSLQMRFASQDAEGYQGKLLSMMRNAFGGHAVVKK
ncbi:MAG: decarboxylating 6-phosphogluconate dehydrogenase [Gammaproteobacteria bacterium]|nr:decarboxylating 6-phosphogluconate dehydrogenase [Gammaproteobacteria bacterium]